MDIIKSIAQKLEIRPGQVEATIELLDSGNTIPFIARYRKEVTGNLTDEQLRNLDTELKYTRNLIQRKEDVKRLLNDQGVLSEELETKLNEALTLQAIEDIYLPFRPKRRTRATIAIEKGLKPLADFILGYKGTGEDIEAYAETFIDAESEIESAEKALSLAKDIIAADASENSIARALVRDNAYRYGVIKTERAKEAADDSVYSNYFEYSERVKTTLPHRILAIYRGEKDGDLKVSLVLEDEMNIERIRNIYIKDSTLSAFKYIDEAVRDGYGRLLFPSIETEVRASLKENADQSSIKVFADNLRPYIMQSPIKGKAILGMDPGFRTGCKLAIISEVGEVLDYSTIYPVPPKARVRESEDTVEKLIKNHGVELIAIGNGTASRETESFVSKLLRDRNLKAHYTIVNESGASIYSASELGQEEFPQLDVTIRGAVSIARRLQDPLAELVKIEPKHIGVGQYQHDVNQKLLDESLHGVVESCVNAVGVDVNTASKSLLKYVSGISSKVADNIINYKREAGLIKSRQEIAKIKGIGPKTFEQCAGFLRIPESDNPLDNTGVHPESYAQAKVLLGKDLKSIDIGEMAAALKIGEITLRDIIEELKKPGRDPREELPEPILRSDIISFDDLEKGMELAGTVRNVVDFGAFVDIGVGTDGLVHISQIADKFIKHPSDVLEVSQIVKVRVLDIDKKRNKISLTMKGENKSSGKSKASK